MVLYPAWTVRMKSRKKTLVSWSSGKDSAWMLYQLQQSEEFEATALLTTLNSAADRVAMHAVRRELLRRQAHATGLPLIEVELPWPCDNETYESLMSAALQAAIEDHSVTHIAFGDLFLEDIRDYREKQLSNIALVPVFPLWRLDTTALANTMIESGLQARISCVDPRQLDARFAGDAFDTELLGSLPDDIDPCGENGEFHTFVTDGPMFRHPVDVSRGKVVTRDGFVFADLVPA